MSKFKDVLRTVAPALATAFGGPLAGMAAKVIGDKLLGKPDATAQEVETYLLNAKPEDLVRLKEIDAGFRQHLADAGVKLEEIAADDRKDARQRSVAMNDRSPILIGFVILLVWGYINISLLQMDKPPAIDAIIVGRILGMVDAATLAFLYWLYGSSVGSKNKDVALANLTGPPP